MSTLKRQLEQLLDIAEFERLDDAVEYLRHKLRHCPECKGQGSTVEGYVHTQPAGRKFHKLRLAPCPSCEG